LNRKYSFWLLCIYSFNFAFLLPASTLYAGWLDGKAEGWAWYEDKQQEETAPEESTSQVKQPTASETLFEIKKDLEEKLALAVLNPTEENISEYMEHQKKWIDQSAKFGMVWSHILMNNPSLDRTVAHPVSQYGIQIKKKLEAEETKELISSLAAKNGLIFFYEGKDKFSQAFAKVVDNFCRIYKWEVFPISVDGAILDLFPESEKDNGISTKMSASIYPALYVVEPESRKATPIAFGFVTIDQIEKNIRTQFKEKNQKN